MMILERLQQPTFRDILLNNLFIFDNGVYKKMRLQDGSVVAVNTITQLVNNSCSMDSRVKYYDETKI